MNSNDPRKESNIEKGSDQTAMRTAADAHGEDLADKNKPSHQAGFSDSDGVTQRNDAYSIEDRSTVGTP